MISFGLAGPFSWTGPRTLSQRPYGRPTYVAGGGCMEGRRTEGGESDDVLEPARGGVTAMTGPKDRRVRRLKITEPVVRRMAAEVAPTYPGAATRIPFSLNGRRGTVTVSYGRNEDPVQAGFDIIPGLGFDIALSRGYPAIQAVISDYQGSGYRTFCGWLQVVTATYYDSYDTRQAPADTSVSVDAAPSMQGLGSPFMVGFGNLPQFFDAPCKNLYQHAQVRWVADTFLTTVPMRSREEEIIRLLGFRWGYVEYDTPEQRPVSLLPLEVTEAQAWNALLLFLRKEFPKWRFGSA